MRLHILVPTKRFDEAKQRLAPALDDHRRRVLSRAMLTGVLRAAARAGGAGGRWVVGGDQEVADLCAREGWAWLPELGRDLNETLVRAVARCAAAGAGGVLILPADLPLLRAADVETVLAAWRPGRAVLVRSRDGAGTNALVLPAAGTGALWFGPGSADLHRGGLEARGLEVVEMEVPGIAADLDVPADLARLAADERFPGDLRALVGARTP
ncbi:MAG: 2-phospho-L-lactate guanylyltransferase [Armatimonadetes bacterium]|nr:2-phospho-L-lactate guanylyltransferase [Armatimonadota bacterium]